MDQVLKEKMFACGYKRCCPRVIIFADRIEVIDDDKESGSIGTIKMTREQALALAGWIKENV